MNEFILQIIYFTFLVVLLVKFLRKPIIDMVSSRQELIRKEVEEARLMKLEAEKKYKEFESKIKNLEAETKEILERTKSDAEMLKNKIIEAAKSTAVRIVKDAEDSSMAAFLDTRNEIRTELVEQAIVAAEKIIRERLSKDDHKRMINEYVGKVE